MSAAARLLLAGITALVIGTGGLALLGLALVVTRPFPDEHDGDNEQ